MNAIWCESLSGRKGGKGHNLERGREGMEVPTLRTVFQDGTCLVGYE